METNQTTILRAAKIAAKNDGMRQAMTGCIVTKGITALIPLINDIFVRVRDFNNFTVANDPYGEHDFGSLEIVGIKILWKIDYYDEDLSGWCDPLDPKCRRQLTIMRADEY
ncbi:MAG: DUF3768 domain-containing protein [Candidatus Saccharimonadales bacterium]